MTASDYIQLSIAVVAGIAAILTAINIIFTNKQFNLQEKQWEYSYVPLFKVKFVDTFSSLRTILIIDSINSVYFQIKEASFSDERVEIDEISNGFVETNGHRIEGIYVKLRTNDFEFINGHLQLKGVDALGNEFNVFSQEIKLEGKRIINQYHVNKSFFNKV